MGQTRSKTPLVSPVPSLSLMKEKRKENEWGGRRVGEREKRTCKKNHVSANQRYARPLGAIFVSIGRIIGAF